MKKIHSIWVVVAALRSATTNAEFAALTSVISGAVSGNILDTAMKTV